MSQDVYNLTRLDREIRKLEVSLYHLAKIGENPTKIGRVIQGLTLVFLRWRTAMDREKC